MNSNYKGNNLIRQLVILTDFIILNLVLTVFYTYDKELLPEYFDSATKITIFVANVALFCGEYFYSTIIHIRKISFWQVLRRTFYLALATTVAFFIFIRLLSNGYKMFGFSLCFGATFYVVLIISRFCELYLLKYYRLKGHNGRNVMFVGSDPAIIEMYNDMTEDPSAGYHIKGYYADQDIPNAPSGLVRLGNRSMLNDIMDSSINNTINGTPINIDELFCCLSHDDSKESIKLMQFCDKNVIHFYYLPRQFGEYKLHLDAQTFLGKTVYSNHFEPLTSLGNRVAKRAFDIFVSGINHSYLYQVAEPRTYILQTGENGS